MNTTTTPCTNVLVALALTVSSGCSPRDAPAPTVGESDSVAAVLALDTIVVGAQTTIPDTQTTIPDAPLCSSCRITTEHLFSFGSLDGPGSLIGYGRVGADVEGRLWYADDGLIPQIFDAQGRFLRELGRRGEGPGEYLGVRWWSQLPGDSMLVFDSRGGRAVVLAPDLRAVRYIAMPVPVDGAIVLAWPQRVLIQARIPIGDRQGFPLHVLDMSGRTAVFQASLTSDGRRPTLPGRGNPLPRHLFARSSNGGAWTAEQANYRISQWDSEANLVNAWTREAPWFYEGPQSGSLRHVVQGMRQDDEGRIWVVIRAPRPDAAEKVEEALSRAPQVGSPGRSARPASALPPPQELYDTIIEVLDLQSGRVLARQRLESVFLGLLPNSRAAVYYEDELGVPRVDIVSLTLTTR